MGLLQELEARFIEPIFNRLKAALGPLGKLFDLVSKFFSSFKTSFQKGLELSQEIIGEINAWKNFKEAVPVRTGVVNIPRAIDKSQELLDQIKAAWDSIVDLAKQIKKQAQGQTEDPAAEAEEAVSDIESSGIKTILEKFPKLAKGLEKLLGFLAVAIGVLESIQSAIDDIKNVVDAIKGIREEIEFGETIFLSQRNKRKTVKLEDGTSMKIRLGSLHQP